MSSFSLVLPLDFSDYELEVSAKGWFSEAILIVSGINYRLTFYNLVRLKQEVEGSLQGSGFFFEPNLIIVNSVTRVEMEKTAALLVKSNQLRLLLPE